MSDDQQLIQQLLDGRTEAEAEFANRYRGLVVGLARGRFGFAAEGAEEIWQTTVVRLWEKDRRALRAWRGKGKLSTYLSVIVTHLCLRERQRAARRAEDPLTASEVTDPSPSAEAEIAALERQKLVTEAIATLSPRDRLLLGLRYRDDRAPSDIATLLGLQPGTARKALHDAVRRLRSHLATRQPELFKVETGNAQPRERSHSPGDT